MKKQGRGEKCRRFDEKARMHLQAWTPTARVQARRPVLVINIEPASEARIVEKRLRAKDLVQ